MKLNIPTKIALLTFFIAGICVMGMAWLGILYTRQLLHDQALQNFGNDMLRERMLLSEKLQQIQQDVMFLAEYPAHRQRLETRLHTILHQQPAYEQISVIAEQGREIMRVEHSFGEKIFSVPNDKLLQLGDRPYFQKALKLQAGQYYLSDARLSREHGRIVYPPKPIIRAAVPVFTSDNKIFGVLVIKINFETLTQFLIEAPLDVFIANHKGDYLFHPDKSKRFAYEFGKRANLQDDFSSINFDFEGASFNLLDQASGLVFQPIYYAPFNPEQFFILGAVASYKTVDAKAAQFAHRLFLLIICVVIVLSVIIAFFVHHQMKPIQTLLRQMFEHYISLGENEIGVQRTLLQSKGEDEWRTLANSLKRQVDERTQALSIRNDAMESAINGIMITEISGEITYVNPAFVQMWGYNRRELYHNKNFFTLWGGHAEGRDMLSQLLQEKRWQGELKTTKPDGSKVIMQLSASMIREEAGIVISFQDSTQRRQAEAALAESERRFRTLFEKAAWGISILNRQGKFISTNPSLQKILGYSDHELRQMTLSEILHPENSRVEKLSTYKVEKQYRTKDGSDRWCSLAVSRLNDSHIICMMENITEQKLNEADREAARNAKAAAKAAEAANRAKSEFLANMSHELRTPLNGILGFTQILKREKSLNHQQRDVVHTIAKSGDHLLTLINDILDLSKIEAGKMELQPQNFQFPEFLKVINDIIEIRTMQKRIYFTYSATSPLPMVVTGDDTRLRQVLVNLLGNAVKFTKRGGVSFKVGYTPYKKIRFHIRDTGTGIAPAQLETIFMPFRQVGDQQHLEGTGLGLSISKKFVEMMGGKLAVKSVLGKGSVFWFDITLPEAEGWEPISQAPERHITGFKGKTRKILVVDDSKLSRLMLVNLFSPLGFEMYEAKNGHEAIEKAQAISPDAILMDIVMPVMDGLEATRRIRHIPVLKDVLIIAASASAFKQHRMASFEAGCNEFVAKPIPNDDLLEKVRLHFKLEWLYEAESNKQESPETIKQPLVPPPAEVLQTLYDLAMMGDVEGIVGELDQLEQMGSQFAPVVAELRQLADAFEVTQLTERIEYYLNKKDSR
ncbi:MAG: PAS domain S-box protein [Pseudomonadota bacterium]